MKKFLAMTVRNLDAFISAIKSDDLWSSLLIAQARGRRFSVSSNLFASNKNKPKKHKNEK